MNVPEIEAREILREGLSKCTEPQIKLFNRMYVSVDKIPYHKMERANDQIKRTIELNVKKGL